MPSGVNPNAAVLIVGGLFFPQSRSLAIDRAGQSPAVLQKVIYAGAWCGSFALASDALRNLADLDVPTKQVERRTKQIGLERCAERDAASAAYLEQPLTVRKETPPGVESPELAVVQMDGGRLQILDRANRADESESVVAATPKRKGQHWREDKVGLLASMRSQPCVEDPCPTVPKCFVDPDRIPRLAQEIKSKSKSPGGEKSPDALLLTDSGLPPPAPTTSRYEPPELVERSIVATKHGVDVFGGLLATAAWERGFFGAKRRVYLGDGSNGNWGVWERHFSSFTPIVDFIHALTYVYAAAMAGDSFTEGWSRYVLWIGALWQGDTATVIAAMEARQQVLGMPEATDGETHPRQCLADALGYLRNQKERMKYAEYRRAGLPITTSHVESTIKQMNHRVKGSEKFWSESGSEAILQLRADVLSETAPLDDFWQRRQARQTGERCYSIAL
jgi:hypothetical protein